MRAIVETVFDIFYLVTVLTVGIRMICGSKSGSQFKLFGLMAVVLGAEVNPLIGMLMIPKTCAYVWTVFIGYHAMKAERGANA